MAHSYEQLRELLPFFPTGNRRVAFPSNYETVRRRSGADLKEEENDDEACKG